MAARRLAKTNSLLIHSVFSCSRPIFSSRRLVFFVNQFVGREIKGFRVRRPFRLRPPFRLVSHLTVRLKMQIIGRPVMS